MCEKLADNVGWLICGATEDASQDTLQTEGGIQRSRSSLALKAPPCVLGYKFISPSHQLTHILWPYSVISFFSDTPRTVVFDTFF